MLKISILCLKGGIAKTASTLVLAGALALVVGVVVYYVLAALRGSVVGGATLAWTLTALVAGPVLGLCGATITALRIRPPALAVVAPAGMLVAEAIFLLTDIQSRSSNPWETTLLRRP